MRPTQTSIALVSAEAAVAALALFFHLSLRLKVLSAFDAFGTEVPPVTRVALSPSLMPVAIGLSAAIVLGAWLLPIKRSRRLRAMQLGVTLLATVVVFAVLAALVPIFRP